jgi:hypothetical protein
MSTITQRDEMANALLDPETVKRGLRINYLGARSEQASKLIDGFATLLARFQKKPFVVNDIMQDAANYIHRQFRLRWVMIGLRDPTDGACTYRVESGMRPEVWEWQKKRTYKKEDFALTKEGWYNAGEISRLTRVYLEEENPLGEQDVAQVVNRPFLMKASRKTQEDTLEADFIDTLIQTADNELLGWIEYSGTIAGKFPDAMVIRWIEFIAAILAAAISSQHAGSNDAQDKRI